MSLQKRFTIAVGIGLIIVSAAALLGTAWLQRSQMMHNLEEFSRNEIESLNSLIVTTMDMRMEDFDDVGIRIFNDWFHLRNQDYPGEVWSVWSDDLIAYMQQTHPDHTAKAVRDAIDREALDTARPVGRLEGGVYRFSYPVVLGVSTGADRDSCHACHEPMGLVDGEAIAVLSSRLDVTNEQNRLNRILAVILFAGVTLTVGGLIAVRQALVSLITRPVGAMTRVMDLLAGGSLDVEVPGGGRRDEIGAMSRALSVLRDNERKRNALEQQHAANAAEREARVRQIDRKSVV